MPKATTISIEEEIEKVSFFPNRTPTTPASEIDKAFTELSEYRDGAIYTGHYAGYSEWEKHPNGDEIVLIIDGSTSLVLLIDGKEVKNTLEKGGMLVVPRNIWHRFESSAGVKVLTVTPQPTEHSIEWPNDD